MRFFLIILVLLMGVSLSSCERDLSSIENPDVHTLISLHNKSKELTRTDVPLSLEAQNELKKAFKSFKNNMANKNMDDFFAEHQLTEIIKATEYLLENESNENVYEALVSNFDFTIAEYEKMFIIAEGAKIVPLVLTDEFPDGMEARYWCAAAVAGYVFQVGTAVLIGGPVGLAAWVVGIGFAATSIVGSCG